MARGHALRSGGGIDTVLMYQDGREMTPKQLVERTHGGHTEDEFALALEVIRAQGL